MKLSQEQQKEGGLKYWACQLCKTRWLRLSVNEVASNTTPLDGDLVQFGQHQGRTYKEILEEFPQYAVWVVMTSEQEAEASPGLLHLAKYLKDKQVSTAPRTNPSEIPFPETDDEIMFPEEWEDTEDPDLDALL